MPLNKEELHDDDLKAERYLRLGVAALLAVTVLAVKAPLVTQSIIDLAKELVEGTR